MWWESGQEIHTTEEVVVVVVVVVVIVVVVVTKKNARNFDASRTQNARNFDPSRTHGDRQPELYCKANNKKKKAIYLSYGGSVGQMLQALLPVRCKRSTGL